MVLKQKDAQMVDLITKSNVRLNKEVEEAKKKLSNKDVILQAAQKKNKDAKKAVQQFRQRLVSFDHKIQETENFQGSAVGEGKGFGRHEGQAQQGAADAGAGVQGQLMRKKALEHGQKLLEKDVRWKESLTKAVEKVESA